MPVFDVHTHVFPDRVATEALAVLSAKSNTEPHTNGTRAGLAAALAEARIDGALNCPIATRADQAHSINDWAARINRWPVLSLGTIHPDMPNPAAEVRRIAEIGLPGVKLHPEYQDFTLDDSRLDTVWHACEELGGIVLIHAGADIGFPPPYHTSPAAFADLLRRHPALRLIAAHFGGWCMWDEVRTHLLGTSCILDTSFTNGLLPPGDIADMVRIHGVDKVVFGTDSPWRGHREELNAFERLPLSRQEKDAILWTNAARLLNLPDPQADGSSDPTESSLVMPRDALLALADADLLRHCRVDTFRGSGRGGQKRNRTESAVRLTLQGTAITAESDATRSQIENRRHALRSLRLAVALAIREPTAAPLGQRPARRSDRYALWAAHVIDALEQCDWRLSEAGQTLALSTGRLVRELAGNPVLWQHALERRQALGLRPLRPPS